MPYYPQAGQGILGPLIGAAVTYFQTKDQLQQDAVTRQYQEAQLKMLPQQMALMTAQAQSEQAKAQAEIQALQPFPGWQTAPKDIQADPTMPTPPSDIGSPQQRSHQMHVYAAGLSAVATTYRSRLAWLASQPQTNAVLSEIATTKENLQDTQKAQDHADSELDRLSNLTQSAADRAALAKQTEAQREADRLTSQAYARGTMEIGKEMGGAISRGLAAMRAARGQKTPYADQPADADMVNKARRIISTSRHPYVATEKIISTLEQTNANPRTIEAVRSIGAAYQAPYGSPRATTTSGGPPPG